MNRLETLLGMLKENPEDSFLRFAIAKEYEKVGDVDMAISEYEKLKKNDPTYVGLYYHLAYLYGAKEDVTSAMAIYNAGIEVAKKASDFHALSELINAKKNLEMESL